MGNDGPAPISKDGESNVGGDEDSAPGIELVAVMDVGGLDVCAASVCSSACVTEGGLEEGDRVGSHRFTLSISFGRVCWSDEL